MWWLPDAEMACKANDLQHALAMLAADHGESLPAFCTACAIHPCDALHEDVSGFISDRVDQIVSEHLFEEVGGDDHAISLSAEHLKGLGKLILEYYKQHGKVKIWAISKNVTEHPATTNNL